MALFLHKILNLKINTLDINFYKSKRKYDFRKLLFNRKNLNIINGQITKLSDNGQYIKLTLSSKNKKNRIILGDKLILAAGGLGNFYILNLLNKRYNHSKYYGHVKGNVATAQQKENISDLEKYFFKENKSIIYYYGFLDKNNESYFQIKKSNFINRKSMDNSKDFLDKLVNLKTLNPVKIIFSQIIKK